MIHEITRTNTKGIFFVLFRVVSWRVRTFHYGFAVYEAFASKVTNLGPSHSLDTRSSVCYFRLLAKVNNS